MLSGGNAKASDGINEAEGPGPIIFPGWFLGALLILICVEGLGSKVLGFRV